jgi:hypothetical protein
MFRGNIDFASRTRVEGWVYCERQSLVGARVHAFVEDACVGTGRVELFRQDLVEAGVGDGRGGFSFAVALDDAQDPRCLHIRVEEGNAIIRQPGSRLAPAQVVPSESAGGLHGPDALAWMFSRGWITQHQLQALKQLQAFGVYQQPLPEPWADPDSDTDWQPLLRMTAELFELAAFGAVASAVRTDLAWEALERERRQLQAQFPQVPPLIALWAPQVSALRVVEGSHTDASVLDALPGSAIEYQFGPETLLWIDLRCWVKVPTAGLGSGLVAFVPQRER